VNATIFILADFDTEGDTYSLTNFNFDINTDVCTGPRILGQGDINMYAWPTSFPFPFPST
jgi:hypothetical protein